MATAPTAAQPVDVGIVVALQDKEVHDLHAAVLAAGLSASRAALMATIDAGFVAGIPTAANLRDQILVDLDALNRTGALADGTVPLRTWLANAEHLAGKQREAAIFARCLARLAAAAPAASSSGPDVHIGRLPSTGRDLFGREADLAWLDACWDEGVRVVSIVAYGGMGKSSLVNGWLRRMDGAGWRGATRVYGWSFYSQGTDRLASSDAFFSEALRWFGDTEAAPTSPWEKGERLAALVRKERALLILDGVEPLQWGPGEQEGKLKDPALLALVKDLGSDNMGLCTTTSRIALTDMEGVGGDRVREKKLNKLSEEAGAQLLGARGAKG